MAVPKQRHTKSRRNKRRMHLYLKDSVLVRCPKCGASLLPHTVCQNCGYYQGREVIDVLKKLAKKERKEREREIQAKKKEEKKEKKEKPVTMEGLSRK